MPMHDWMKSDPRFYDPEHEWPTDGQPAWWVREDDRLNWNYPDKNGGHYQRLPNKVLGEMRAYVWGHYPHLSTKHPGMIAFTKSYAHGVADRKTVMKPGRYFQKYYSWMDGPTIARLSEIINAEFAPAILHFARTREEIVHVYTHGPDSCMSHDLRDYDCRPFHPCEPYATPDLAVAYLLSNEDDPTSITARALCRMDRESGKPVAWVRAYGNERKLRDALRELGAEQDYECLAGAELLFMPYRGGFVCPYLDGHNQVVRVEPKKKRLIVHEGGWTKFNTYDADNTSGLNGRGDYSEYSDPNGPYFVKPINDGELLSEDGLSKCHDCGRSMGLYDDTYYVEEHEGHICEDCRDNYMWVDDRLIPSRYYATYRIHHHSRYDTEWHSCRMVEYDTRTTTPPEDLELVECAALEAPCDRRICVEVWDGPVDRESGEPVAYVWGGASASFCRWHERSTRYVYCENDRVIVPRQYATENAHGNWVPQYANDLLANAA